MPLSRRQLGPQSGGQERALGTSEPLDGWGDLLREALILCVRVRSQVGAARGPSDSLHPGTETQACTDATSEHFFKKDIILPGLGQLGVLRGAVTAQGHSVIEL